MCIECLCVYMSMHVYVRVYIHIYTCTYRLEPGAVRQLLEHTAPSVQTSAERSTGKRHATTRDAPIVNFTGTLCWLEILPLTENYPCILNLP